MPNANVLDVRMPTFQVTVTVLLLNEEHSSVLGRAILTTVEALELFLVNIILLLFVMLKVSELFLSNETLEIE